MQGPVALEVELVLLVRVLLAAVLGGLLGFERERRGRPAGLRTFMVVAAGACLFTMVGAFGFADDASPSRIASGIVVGIGFLGAGSIVQHKKGGSIRGLTTAAGIWTTAAIGAAVGAGLLVLATGATLVLFVILSVLRLVQQAALHRPPPAPPAPPAPPEP
jgi:putative Mg2+ transporter-C (MgtC) family protein